jgi:uncharacterized protein (TIGR00730 family)
MNICVFCGSGLGNNPLYLQAAQDLAHNIIQSDSSLIYGGGNVGLMGVIADHILAKGGKVFGVIPDFLMKKEVGHKGITELIVVNSMHERKKRMADMADAFIAMPGGWGTLDELAEILTWKQLGLINKPIGLLNTNSYFTPLIAQMEKMVAEGFLNQKSFADLIIQQSPQKLLASIGAVIV